MVYSEQQSRLQRVRKGPRAGKWWLVKPTKAGMGTNSEKGQCVQKKGCVLLSTLLGPSVMVTRDCLTFPSTG